MIILLSFTIKLPENSFWALYLDIFLLTQFSNTRSHRFLLTWTYTSLPYKYAFEYLGSDFLALDAVSDRLKIIQLCIQFLYYSILTQKIFFIHFSAKSFLVKILPFTLIKEELIWSEKNCGYSMKSCHRQSQNRQIDVKIWIQRKPFGQPAKVGITCGSNYIDVPGWKKYHKINLL